MPPARANLIIGALLAAITAGAAFWATSVDNSLHGLREDIRTMNKELGDRLDKLLEFKAASIGRFQMYEYRLNQLEHEVNGAR